MSDTRVSQRGTKSLVRALGDAGIKDFVTLALGDVVGIERESDPQRQEAKLAKLISEARRDLDREAESVGRQYLVGLTAAIVASTLAVAGAGGLTMSWPGAGTWMALAWVAVGTASVAILGGGLAALRREVKKRREFESKVLETYLETRRELLTKARG